VSGHDPLRRFENAQDQGGTYERAVSELRANRKRSHWMWFIFPQISGLGQSEMSRTYAISSLAEARAYVDDPVLGARLIECARILTELTGVSAQSIFSGTDAMKLRSSMTLFACAAPEEPLFAQVLADFFGGVRDPATEALLQVDGEDRDALAGVLETPGPAIRRASAQDRAQVVRTVTAAFRDDPGWEWLLDGDYERVAPLFAGALFDLRILGGDVWVAENLTAVAMWDQPDAGSTALAEEVWARYRVAAGAWVSERLDVYNQALAAASPAGSYWYLGVLATDPASQRKGLATALFAPVLGKADESQTACCLETSTEANRRFYEHRGFTEATSILLPDGPPTWWLRRPARG
jgi:uncharacterized protein (DUF1810 family)/GNAT superfamily N-acetyltransferase